ncbi:HlyD family efflux transporter periplasmic adaptor subunit [Mesorhizobium sp. 1M-11]|uniref:HlyD family efflux transporter periplasmic adaptor subunit n=1 Tax=Mesorhizobium sp. 1M-11 TaxID=1529006 RepID=UPI00137AE2A8|nr:HlyD family efflux transporter periplasmic adaptor subunit [Mesorhizobium sp. 1M-11]
MSQATQDPRLQRPNRAVYLAVFLSALLVCVCFFQISLGVSAKGILRPAGASTPIVAERAGVLTFVASERKPVVASAGQTIASIRNLDLVTMRRAPNLQYSLADLAERRKRAEASLENLRGSFAAQAAESVQMEKSLQALSNGLNELQPVYDQDLKRLTSELDQKRRLMDQGLVRKEQIDVIQNLLTERTIQARETRLREASIITQLSELRVKRGERADAYERDRLALENQLSEIKSAQTAEPELQTIDVVMPKAGTILPRGFAAGQTVKSGDLLFDITDEKEDYLFEVDVPAPQIGELKEGLSAKIEVTAYPFSEYGFVDGRVRYFTRAPNEPISFSTNLPTGSNFRLIVEPDPASFKAFLKEKAIVPGMEVTVHIRKEKVAIWRLLLKPLLRFQSRVSA